jgi:hypothetical protein
MEPVSVFRKNVVALFSAKEEPFCRIHTSLRTETEPLSLLGILRDGQIPEEKYTYVIQFTLLRKIWLDMKDIAAIH